MATLKVHEYLRLSYELYLSFLLGYLSRLAFAYVLIHSDDWILTIVLNSTVGAHTKCRLTSEPLQCPSHCSPPSCSNRRPASQPTCRRHRRRHCSCLAALQPTSRSGLSRRRCCSRRDGLSLGLPAVAVTVAVDRPRASRLPSDGVTIATVFLLAVTSRIAVDCIRANLR